MHTDIYRPAVGSDVVLAFAVAAADGSQHGGLHPAQGVVAQPGCLAERITCVHSQQPVCLVAAVGSLEHTVEHPGGQQVRHSLAYRLVREG